MPSYAVDSIDVTWPWPWCFKTAVGDVDVETAGGRAAAVLSGGDSAHVSDWLTDGRTVGLNELGACVCVCVCTAAYKL